jgi:hypothetical protein
MPATSRRPRRRYLVGEYARVLATLATRPPSILDRLRRRILEQPRPGALYG